MHPVRQSRTLYLVLEGLVSGLGVMPRAVEGWHDGAEVPSELESDDGAPSALV